MYLIVLFNNFILLLSLIFVNYLKILKYKFTIFPKKFFIENLLKGRSAFWKLKIKFSEFFIWFLKILFDILIFLESQLARNRAKKVS